MRNGCGTSSVDRPASMRLAPRTRPEKAWRSCGGSQRETRHRWAVDVATGAGFTAFAVAPYADPSAGHRHSAGDDPRHPRTRRPKED